MESKTEKVEKQNNDYCHCCKSKNVQECGCKIIIHKNKAYCPKCFVASKFGKQ